MNNAAVDRTDAAANGSETARAHAEELASGTRFAFGRNWLGYSRLIDQARIEQAAESLAGMLGRERLDGLTFLDAGSGSGLFSAAARRLGARVHSFDFDPASVQCTRETRQRFHPDDSDWTVESGSLLDAGYMDALPEFDIVYCWGVAHHTGAMSEALDAVARRVAADGTLFVALYNDQGFVSRYWTFVKRAWNRHPLARPPLLALHTLYPTVPRVLLHLVTGRRYERGMNPWYDLLDWLGGYPFEVAKPGEILDFGRERGFELARLKTVGGRTGCNEFVFVRRSSAATDAVA